MRIILNKNFLNTIIIIPDFFMIQKQNIFFFFLENVEIIIDFLIADRNKNSM